MNDVESPWLVGADEIAAYLRMNPHEVGALLRAGELRGHQRKRGGTWRCHRTWCDAYLASETPPAITSRRSA